MRRVLIITSTLLSLLIVIEDGLLLLMLFLLCWNCLPYFKRGKGPSLSDVSKSPRTLSAAVSCYSCILFIHLLSPLDSWMPPFRCISQCLTNLIYNKSNQLHILFSSLSLSFSLFFFFLLFFDIFELLSSHEEFCVYAMCCGLNMSIQSIHRFVNLLVMHGVMRILYVIGWISPWWVEMLM